MKDDIQTFTSRWTRSANFIVVASTLALVACGPKDEETEIVDVDPYESVSQEEPGLDEAVSTPGAPKDEELIIPAPSDQLGNVTTTRFAEAAIRPASGSSVTGTVAFTEEDGMVRIEGQITGLAEGKHGLHVHETGDCSSPDASSAGGHFAPDDSPHGAPQEIASAHHAGDLGNIVANSEGVADINIQDATLSLGTGENTVIGRSIIVHSDADDLATQPSGDAGKRVGCGIISVMPEPAYGS